MDKQINRWRNRYIDGEIDKQMEKQINRWINRLIDGQIDKQIFQKKNLILILEISPNISFHHIFEAFVG